MLKFTKKKFYIILFAVIVAAVIVICFFAGTHKEKAQSRQAGISAAQKDLKETKNTTSDVDKKNTTADLETQVQTEPQTTPEPQTEEKSTAGEPTTEESTESATDELIEPTANESIEPTTDEPIAEEQPKLPVEPQTQIEPSTFYEPKIKDTSEYLIAIDAGHQAQGNYEKEPIGPGASETKNKVAGGTSGVVTGIPEYELTLSVALKLKSILLDRGYQVLMIRESNQVNISNAERAIMANNAGADVFIRIHADAVESGNASGMTALCQTPGNPYNGALYFYSRSLSNCLLDAMAAQTGARKRGVTETDTMSGINWAQVPVAIIEMGFMTNAEEDRLMSTEDYQNKLALGMADGIENYLAGLE